VTSFTIGDDDFLLDGKPFRVLAGALHYFRVHPDLWRDRIQKAKSMGLNTIETYIAWNEHSPKPGTFDLTGGLDIARFLDIVHDEGMFAIVRPGPYICAEWDNGGLPAWLFTNPAVGIRRSEPLYLDHVGTYLREVYSIVTPRQISRGGPVILVQIENEYGAYGSDTDYLEALVALTLDAGIDVPLTTVDQPTDEMLAAGSLPSLHRTGSFGSRSAERLATLRRHQPTGPLMCSEFWDGWFDFWGAHHHTTSVTDAAAELRALLAAGASVNIYMFHGGTNFGLTNGANDKGTYQATTTSYDYDAPLDEAGHPTAKYFAFQEVLAEYADVQLEQPVATPDAPTFSVQLENAVALLPAAPRVGEWLASRQLPTLDALGHYRGFALFRTEITGDGPGVLSFGEVRDRAAVYLDGSPVGVLLRDHRETSIALPATSGELTVLVEDQGRVNYGPRIGESKGLIGGAFLDGVPIENWSALPIDLERLYALAVDAPAGPRGPIAGPAVATAVFDLAAVSDLFLDTAGLGKGVAWINGFLLGRYWRRGPQETLYVPATATTAGKNRLVVFELEAIADPTAHFVPGLRLGQTDF
jgi:beta-galactosidase